MVKNFLKKAWHHWRVLLGDRAFQISLLVGLVVWIVAMQINMYFGEFNDVDSYTPVKDAILDRIPTYNLEFLFTWGFYSVIASIFVYAVFWKPELVPFALKTFGLLIIIRSIFTMMTHFGPPNGFFYENGFKSLDDNPFKDLIFKNDLFFSGHVAITFLAFLIFPEGKFKWFMLFASIVMSVTVLLMHVHYSIDVFAAFFITYGIFALSKKIFNGLNLRFRERINNSILTLKKWK